jgi:hypothetical protein
MAAMARLEVSDAAALAMRAAETVRRSNSIGMSPSGVKTTILSPSIDRVLFLQEAY